MLNKVILLFGLAEPEAKALSAAFAAVGLGTFSVPAERSAMPLWAILEGRRPISGGTALPEPIAVFHGLSDRELDRALAVLREGGAPIQLKAVTTPTNLQWTPAELWRNLAAERKALSKGKRKH